MDNPISRMPFDPYDFFGYLTSGLLVLVGMDLVFGFPCILGKDLKVVEAGLLVIAIYVTGQIIATPAKAILEDGLVDKLLGRPNINLFRTRKKSLQSVLFPGYYKPLPEKMQLVVLKKAEVAGFKETGEDFFLYVRYNPVILQNQRLMDKLGSFLNKYGFNRNLSFTCLLLAIALLIKIGYVGNPDPQLLKYAVAALVAGILLFYRYLKFFRQYSYEMFNTYGRAE